MLAATRVSGLQAAVLRPSVLTASRLYSIRRPEGALVAEEAKESRNMLPPAEVDGGYLKERPSVQLRSLLADVHAQMQRESAAFSRSSSRQLGPAHHSMLAHSGDLDDDDFDQFDDEVQEAEVIATHVQRAHARLRHAHMETMFGPSLVARHMASAGFHDPSIVAVPLTLDMMPFVPKKIEAAALSMQTWALKESRKQAAAQALQLSAGTDDEEAKPAVYASGIIKKRRKKMKKHKYRKRLKKTRALRKALKKI